MSKLNLKPWGQRETIKEAALVGIGWGIIICGPAVWLAWLGRNL